MSKIGFPLHLFWQHLDEPFQLQVDALLQTGPDGIGHPVSSTLTSWIILLWKRGPIGSFLASKHFEVYVGGGGKGLVYYKIINPLTFRHSLQNPHHHLMWCCLFLQPLKGDILYVTWKGLRSSWWSWYRGKTSLISKILTCYWVQCQSSVFCLKTQRSFSSTNEKCC